MNTTNGRPSVDYAISIFFACENGFDKVIRRCGRRVLIDEAAFFEWMEEQNGGR